MPLSTSIGPVVTRLPFGVILSFAGNAELPAAKVPITLRHSMAKVAVNNAIDTVLSHTMPSGLPAQGVSAAIGEVNLADAQLTGLETITRTTPVLVEYSEAILMKTLGYPNVFYPVFEKYSTELDNSQVRTVVQIIKVGDMPQLNWG